MEMGMEVRGKEVREIKKETNQEESEKEFRVCAAMGSVPRMKELLLSCKVDINKQASESTFTALHRACEFQQKFAVKFLLTHKAQLNLQTKEGNSALHLVIFPFLAKVDIKESSQCKGKSKEELTIQQIQNKLEIMDMLLEHGANPLLENKKGETPFMLLHHIRDSSVLNSDVQQHGSKTILLLEETLIHLRKVTRKFKTYAAEQGRKNHTSVKILTSGKVIFTNDCEKLLDKDPAATMISITPFLASSTGQINLAPHC